MIQSRPTGQLLEQPELQVSQDRGQKVGGGMCRQADTHTHKGPYFGGHPFHFTRYSTLPWGKREADTVIYTVRRPLKRQ